MLWKQAVRPSAGFAALILAAALLAGGSAGSVASAEESLRFTSPDARTLRDLVDIAVSAPDDTSSVRFYIDDIQLAEITDRYSGQTGTDPVWRTATDAGWLRPGSHVLRAEADTPEGVVTAERRILTQRPAPAEGGIPATGAWRFAAESELPGGDLEGEMPPAVMPEYDDREFASLMVPNSLGAVDDRYNDWNGLLGVYRRVVDLEDPTSGEQTAIVLESCYWQCRVFVNGEFVGESVGGYLPERLDITDAAVPGENTLAVVVDHRRSTMGEFARINEFYWNWGGLLQEARIERTPEVALVDLRAEGARDGTLTLRATGVNPTDGAQPIEATVDVEGPLGESVIAAQPISLDVAPGGAVQPVELTVDDPKLWDLDDPNLYTVRMTSPGTEEPRELVGRTGFRDVAVAGSDVTLNGKVVSNLQGFNRHRDYPGLGRTQPDGLARRDLAELHAHGFRIYRPAHYPATPAELDVADELGLLVIEEINVTGLAGDVLASPEVMNFGRDRLTRAIERDRSHPSIIGWSVGNENQTEDPEAVPYVRDTIAAGRKLDPTRLYTQVSHRATRDLTYEYQDFVASNIYAGWYTNRSATELGSDPVDSVVSSLDRIQDYSGGKPIILSEYGAEAVKGRAGTGKGTETYQGYVVDEHNRLLNDRPHTLGKMYWTSTEFWCRPDWSGGNPDPVPPFHTKALQTLNREAKLAWRVMFAPIRITDTSVLEAPAGEDTTVTAEVTISDIAGRSTSGEVVVDAPDGFSAARARHPFDVAADGQTTVEIELSGTLADTADEINGLVRAVVDDDTEAQPRLLTIRRADVVDHPASDPFDTSALDDAWSITREEPAGWGLADRAGSLRLTTLAGGQEGETNDGRNLFLRENTPASDFTAVADVTADLNADGQRVALTAHVNDDDYVEVALARRDGGPSIEFVHERDGAVADRAALPLATEPATLRLVRRAEQLSAEYSTDGTIWRRVGAARLPGTLRVGLQASGGHGDPPPPTTSTYVNDLRVLVPGRLTVDAIDAELPMIGDAANTATVTISNSRAEAAEITAGVDVPDGWASGSVTKTVEPFSSAEFAVPVTPPLEPAVGVGLTASATAAGLPVYGRASMPVVTTPPGDAVALALDAGTANSPLVAGYERLSPDEDWDPERGFGWATDAPSSRDRGEPRWCGSACEAPELDDLRRDFVLDRQRPTTLRVQAPPGVHQVYVLAGDATGSSGDTIVSDADGNVLDSVGGTQSQGEFAWLSFPIDGGTDGRPADLVITGGGGNYWRVNAVVVMP